MAAPESLADQHRGMGIGDIVHGDVAHALLTQAVCQDGGGIFRVPVDRAIGDDHAPLLRRIGAPALVFFNEPGGILAPDGPVQRAEILDIQTGGLFQQVLHLRAILAHDVGVIPPGIVQPVLFKVHLVGKEITAHSTEGAECVGGEEDLVGFVVSSHGLRPMNHRCHHESQLVAAGGEHVSLLHHQGIFRHGAAEELADHGEGLGIAHHLGLRMAAQQRAQSGAVIRLHVVHHHIVQLPVLKQVIQILKEQLPHGEIHRVQEDGLLVQQQIGIVGNAPGDGVSVFK